MRDGDPDIYVMDANGGNVQRLTDEVGYDGGPFFSFDGQKIVYRAYHPTAPEEIARYKAALEQGLIGLRRLEIFVMATDSGNKRQLTNNGTTNFAPFFHPDGKRIIFASNLADPKGFNFDLYIINLDGSRLERITYDAGFDSFPMFSSDGKRLVFASNRHARVPGETNIFIADWIE